MRTTLLIACLAGLLSVARGGSPPAQSTPERGLPEQATPAPPAAPARPSAERPDPNAAELEAELARFLNVYSTAAGNSARSTLDRPGDLRRRHPRHAARARPALGVLRSRSVRAVTADADSVSKGFGSVVSVLPGRVIILQTQSGSPSQRAGLLPGDEILAVNDIPLARLDFDQFLELLGASRQHPARLVIRRQGTAGLLSFTMVPAEMQADSVDRVYRIDDGTGYLRITSFEALTAQQLKKAIEKLGGTKRPRSCWTCARTPAAPWRRDSKPRRCFFRPARACSAFAAAAATPRTSPCPRGATVFF